MLHKITCREELCHLRKLCVINNWTYEPHVKAAIHPRRVQRACGDILVATSQSNDAKDVPRWIVQDDLFRKRRTIAIQGSYTLEHWKQNLRFQPKAFIDNCLETYVHHGCYESALRLFDTLHPYVEEAKQLGLQRVDLTGHSIGGSIAILLKLMLHYWNVERPGQVYAYAFGSPAVFSEQDQDAWLLQRMHIPDDSIQNIAMHKDIVPKAFSCDYSIVRNVLTILPWFALHPNLNRPHLPHVYSFVGRMYILQPPIRKQYGKNTSKHGTRGTLQDNKEHWHSQLPYGEPGLYKLLHDPQDPQALPRFLERFMNDPHPLQVLFSKNDVIKYHSIDHYALALKELARCHDHFPK